MIIFLVVRMFLHLFAGMATCAFIFPFLDRPARQARIRHWSARLVHICGLSIVMRGSDGHVLSEAARLASAPPALMVANHISWLDIFVINALEPCRFVAKSDIRNWPLIGWLCARTGTIFISRGRPRDVRAIFQGLVTSIKDGHRIAFFPEGTTAAQGSLLPFHANLFEAALDAGVPVQPYALRYLDQAGALHPAADFIGDMSIVESILTILKARSGNRITAELIVLEPIAVGAETHRRDLAAAARKAIVEALDHQPASAAGAVFAANTDLDHSRGVSPALPSQDNRPGSTNDLQDITQ